MTLPHSIEHERAVVICNICQKPTGVERLNKDGRNKDGTQKYRKRCIDCAREAQRKSKERFYLKNRDACIARAKAWKLENHERALQNQRKNYDPQRQSAYYQKYQSKNREKINARSRERWRKKWERHEERIKSSVRGRFYKALKAASVGKPYSALEGVGCSMPELMIHLQSRFKPGMSWNNYGEWHVDHIRPVASFDFNDSAQVSACFHYSNLQPLWAKENHQKGAR